MPATLLEPPNGEPLSLEEAKAFLRVDHVAEDTLIGSLIVAARGHIETATRHCLLGQVWRVAFDAWPPDGQMRLPFAPAQAIVAARVRPRGGKELPIDTMRFTLATGALPGMAAYDPGGFVALESGPVELDVRFGYGSAADVPPPLLNALRMLVAFWYEHRLPESVPRSVEALIAPYRGRIL